MDSWLTGGLLVITPLLYLLYRYLTSTYNYFKARGIPYLRPTPVLGHLGLFTKSRADISKDLYSSFPGEKFFGYFEIKKPTLLVKDPELVHRIMVKDFIHFQDHGFQTIEGDILSKNLFHLRGQSWRSLRHKLLPTFTSGRLKNMFSQFNLSGENLVENISQSSVGGEPVNANLFSNDFTTEVIASTAFGLNFSKNSPQLKEFNQWCSDPFVTGLRQIVMFILNMFAPNVLKWLNSSFLKPGATNYFLNLTKANKEYRKRNNFVRNDYFQLLISLQDSGNDLTSAIGDQNDEDSLISQLDYSPQDKLEHITLTDEDVTAQMVVFLLGGLNSVSETLNFSMYHIAKDTNVQERAAREVDSVLAQYGGWSYQAVKELTYLDQVLQETLRLYPLIPVSLRVCTLPYCIPDSDVVLEKGAVVAVPVMGLHMDPQFYPNPELFDPERFAGNCHKPSLVYMPFGDGPRMCIGMRFALLEMKVFLGKILSQFSIEVDNKTQEPITFDRSSFSPKAVGGIWINFRKRRNTPS